MENVRTKVALQTLKRAEGFSRPTHVVGALLTVNFVLGAAVSAVLAGLFTALVATYTSL